MFFPCASTHSIFLLAQTTAATGGPDPATLNQAMVFIGGLTACAVIANQVLGAMTGFRKLRGADPAEDLRYVTKPEHQALKDEVLSLKSEFQGLARTITHEFSELNRSIGVLEGMLTTMNGRPKD
jgi:hypothetical protein